MCGGTFESLQTFYSTFHFSVRQYLITAVKNSVKQKLTEDFAMQEDKWFGTIFYDTSVNTRCYILRILSLPLEP